MTLLEQFTTVNLAVLKECVCVGGGGWVCMYILYVGLYWVLLLGSSAGY